MPALMVPGRIEIVGGISDAEALRPRTRTMIEHGGGVQATTRTADQSGAQIRVGAGETAHQNLHSRELVIRQLMLPKVINTLPRTARTPRRIRPAPR